jgi:hypothetical protein
MKVLISALPTAGFMLVAVLSAQASYNCSIFGGC